MATAVQPIPITPPPGVVKTETERVIQGRWSDSNMIRFFQGRPEKRGGWVKAFEDATSGEPRAIHAWRDNASRNYLAAGTYRKLYTYDENGDLIDITPLASSGTLGTDPLAVVSGSPIVTVTDAAHGVSPNDTIIIAGAAALGGITPNGEFLVATVIDANHYTYVFTSDATSTDADGGGASVTFQYEISVGTEVGSFGLGWGVGLWGIGFWGMAHEGSTVFLEPRIWSLDHFGQLLLAAYNGGALYSFDPTQSKPWARAQRVAEAPTDFRAMFITPERFVFALRESMIVSWSSQNEYDNWTPGVDSTAGSRTLTEGTKLVGGSSLGPFVSLIWTDSALYLFQYTGTQFVYNSSLAGKDCGLIAPHAAVTVDGVAYWMGSSDFWMFNGSIQRMPHSEDIQSFVFQNLKPGGLYQAHAVYNPLFREIEFFYTENGDDFPTKSVTYSIADQCWAPHVLTRTASTHYTQGDIRPYMGGSDGFIYLHEEGYNADGVPIAWTMTLAPYAVSEGYVNIDIEGILFDFFAQSGSIDLLLESWDRLTDDDPMDTEVEVITVNHGLTDTRISGRYIGFTLSQSVLDGYMRFGRPAVFTKQIGRRR